MDDGAFKIRQTDMNLKITCKCKELLLRHIIKSSHGKQNCIHKHNVANGKIKINCPRFVC